MPQAGDAAAALGAASEAALATRRASPGRRSTPGTAGRIGWSGDPTRQLPPTRRSSTTIRANERGARARRPRSFSGRRIMQAVGDRGFSRGARRLAVLAFLPPSRSSSVEQPSEAPSRRASEQAFWSGKGRLDIGARRGGRFERVVIAHANGVPCAEARATARARSVTASSVGPVIRPSAAAPSARRRRRAPALRAAAQRGS